MAFENPYKPRQVDLKLFFGKDRAKLVKEICNDLRTYCESSAVVGGQRMGKTTLLMKIKEELSDKGKVQCFYVDAQSRPQLGDSNAAFAWLGSHAGMGNSGYTDFGRVLKTTWVSDRGYSKVVFLIDEFDAFGAYEWHRHFFDNLRSLLVNNMEIRDRLGVVVAGPRKLESLLLGGEGSPLGNILSWRYLALLDEEDSKQLVSVPTDANVPEDVQELVFDKTGGQPYFIQYLMSKAYDGNPDETRPKLNRAEADFIGKNEQTFRLWWDNHLEANERAVFSLLLQSGSLSKSAIRKELPGLAVKDVLRTLSYIGFVKSVGEEYAVAGSILRKWASEYL